MGIHLPDEVHAAMVDAGLSDDEVQDKTGDELRAAIGDQLTYELVVALAGQRLTVARSPGRRAKMPQDDLIERNLDVLKLRLIDGLNFKAIGRKVGLTGSRVAEVLRIYFGVDAKPHRPAPVLNVPAESVPVLRAALLGRFRVETDALQAALAAGEGYAEAHERMNDIYWLLCEVAADEDVTLSLQGRRKANITQALREHTDSHACKRLLERL